VPSTRRTSDTAQSCAHQPAPGCLGAAMLLPGRAPKLGEAARLFSPVPALPGRAGLDRICHITMATVNAVLAVAAERYFTKATMRLAAIDHPENRRGSGELVMGRF
jgi:hypothetical protein